MSKGEEALRRRYRELAHEEPSALIDAAILAAAKRVAARRALSHRWAVPMCAAALFVLALGVTLRMQQEQPGIETAMPSVERGGALAPSMSGDAARTSSAPADALRPKPPLPDTRQESARRAQKPPAPLPPVGAARPAVPSSEPSRLAKPQPASPAAAKERVPAAQSAASASAQAGSENEPKKIVPREEAAVPPAAEPVARPDRALARAAPTPAGALPQVAADTGAALRAKREELPAGRLEDSRPPALPARDEELERIARLRREGRHAEADKALEEFRKQYPDYRIPQAVWDRVKPR